MKRYKTMQDRVDDLRCFGECDGFEAQARKSGLLTDEVERMLKRRREALSNRTDT